MPAPASAPASLVIEYERQLEPARSRFAASPILAALTAPDIDPLVLELFLLHFAAMGVRMTEPVEGWIRRAAQRCADLGNDDLARALRGHASAEAGHHLMMVRDTHTLTARLKARHGMALDARALLAAAPSAGAIRYIEIHEAVIAGPVPAAQVALEFEIEMLPVRYGPPMVKAWVARLGPDILESVSFITEHIDLDVGHTKFNSQQLERQLVREPASLPDLVAAGTEILLAYGQFLSDCLDTAMMIKRKEHR